MTQWVMKTIWRFMLAVMLLPLLLHQAFGQCPSPEAILKGLSNFPARDVQVVAVRPTTYAEICEVHIRVQNRDQIIYVGPRGDFFLMGQLYDASSGQNLTRGSLEAVTRFSAAEMLYLKELAAFSIGNSNKTLYYVTDPQCPYCKEGSKILEKLVSEASLQVYFVLFPLPSHEGAREQSISVICDRKSLPEFEGGYRSDNQCPEGAAKIDETYKFLKAKGIGGTPTYIFPDGRFHSGLIQEAELRSRLGLPAQN